MKSLLSQGVRYLFVGGLNVLITLAAFWVFDHLLSPAIGVLGAYWLSALLGILNGFIWQRLLVWRSRNRWHAEFVRFFVFNVVASAINSLLLVVAVDVVRLPAFPSQVVFTGIFVLVSFLINRSWVFRLGATVDEPGDDLPPRLDVFLQYYKPHVSGLTNVAADLAEYTAAQGYDVHVHCVSTVGEARHYEHRGVAVHAYRRSFSLGRAVFSLQLVRQIWRMRRLGGIAHAHLPYPEAALLAWALDSTWRLVGSYQCDAPRAGGASNLIARVLDASHRAFVRRADVTATSSEDYALSSRLHEVFASSGSVAIPATSIDRRGGRAQYAAPGIRQIGFLGRPTSEKGIDVLLDALELLPEEIHLLIGGPIEGLSEKVSFDAAKLDRLTRAGRVRSLGFVPEASLRDFYASLDVFVLPSTNSFEAFGIVQVEAMSAGIPVVASNLPGVRTIVETTGFGAIAAVGDARDLARGIFEVLGSQYDRESVRDTLENRYLSPIPEEAYLAIYRQLSEA